MPKSTKSKSPEAKSVGSKSETAGGGASKPAAKRLSLVLLLLPIALALSFFAWTLTREYQAFVLSPMPLAKAEQRVVIDLPTGSGLDALLAQLERAGVPNTPRWQWRLLLWQLGLERKLKAGEYAISAEMTPRDVLNAIAEGKVVKHTLTIVEGSRFKDLREKLVAHQALKQTLAELDDSEVLKRIGVAEEHPEGLFLPETYTFTRGYSDLELLQNAYWAMQRTLNEAWERRRSDLPLKSAYEALILASIIEKETGHAPERGEIGGVFTRRLKLGMKLQTDPTVIYGLGDAYDGNIRRRDLTTDTPYNTYTRYGLPPTPIALPGKAAIMAAVQPKQGESLYFVARGDGRHQFSSNYEDHRAAVQKYQLGQ
jgi:UPF0755 protein